MELRSVEKTQKKKTTNHLMWNQKTKFQLTDKRTKICLQPCFRFLKANLLHRVCLLRLPLAGTPLGPNLARDTRVRARMQGGKRTEQSTCSSERSDGWTAASGGRSRGQLRVAASENAEEGRSPLPDAGLKHPPAEEEEEATKDV